MFCTVTGSEVAVATTKGYNAQLIAGDCVAVQFGLVRGVISEADYEKYIKELQTIPNNRLQWFACKYTNAHDMFFIGRGIDYAICLEGSLKIKEISYIHSEAYAAGVLKHGTIRLLEDGTLVIGVLTQKWLL